MKTFKSLAEIQPYYNKETNTYDFAENGICFDVCFAFDLSIDSNITAQNINAWNIHALKINAQYIEALDINAQYIDALDIYARNITALDINAQDIDALDIYALDIYAWNINAQNINAQDIDALDINACNIDACNIDACNINACNIDAQDISFYAFCCAYTTFICKSITGRRENAKYFCLDSEVKIGRYRNGKRSKDNL